MLKLTGIILISGAISMYGAYLSGNVKKSRAFRKGLAELLIHIKNGIDNGGIPLTEIYASFSCKALEKCEFLSVLKDGKSESFSRALKKCEIKLAPEVSEIYERLSKELGKSSSGKSESEKLARAIALAEKEEKKLDAEDSSKIELYSKLGVLCGILAALLLI